MAATELIAVGTGAAVSADIVVIAGLPLTVCLKDADGTDVGSNCRVDIQLKADDGQYYSIGILAGFNGGNRAIVLSGPGTYRLSRPAGSDSCGAFSA